MLISVTFTPMKRTLILLMALWVLISTLTFPVSSHFCGGTLRSMAVFTKAKSCHHAAEAATAELACLQHPNSDRISREGCCLDQLLVVKGLVLPVNPTAAPTIATAPAWAIKVPVAYNLASLICQTLGRQADYLHFRPPVLAHNLPVLFQSFLF